MATHIGKDPLTWTFVKLFARQITEELGEFEGVPGSHAWKWQRDGIWRSRLVTKAHVVGTLVSVHERTERVEFVIDDGTALIKATRWSPDPWDKRVVLGDLVHVLGKLNMDKHAHDSSSRRELRVAHIARIDDPNEEALHWATVLELTQTVYSAPSTQSRHALSFSLHAPSTATSSSSSSESAASQLQPLPLALRSATSSSAFDQLTAVAFFERAIDSDTHMRFITRRRNEPHDVMLLELLETLLAAQSQSTDDSSDDAHAVRVTFVETLARLAQQTTAATDDDDVMRPQRIRLLRKTFATLRRVGLLFLEDDDADRYVFVTFAFVLAPALVHLLRDTSVDGGLSIAELTERVVTQRKFARLSLAWLERALQLLLAQHVVVQHEATQRFHLA